MRVFIPATRQPAWQGGTVVYLGDDEAYWRFWSDLWAAAEDDVIVVEHDVLPPQIALDELASCDSLWCTQPYRYVNYAEYHGLGCVKFSRDLMLMTPDLWDQVAGMSDGKHPPRHWCRLDAWSQIVLQELGAKRCEHNTAVAHDMRGRSAHGCV